MQPKLASWSWQSITATYVSLGSHLKSYSDVQSRIELPAPTIDRNDAENTFLMRFWGDVRRIDNQLAVLDAEIARRNKLIGVMG